MVRDKKITECGTLGLKVIPCYNQNMSSIFFALISLIGWGTGDIFTTSASRRIGSYNASFYGYFFGFILSSIYIPFALDQISAYTIPLIALTIFLSVIQLLSFLSYNEALKIGNSSLVGTIAGAFTSLVVVLSILFLGERLLPDQLISISVIIVGLILSSLNLSDLKNKRSIINKGTTLALVAMIGWGIYFTFIKVPIEKAGFFWPTYTTAMVGTLSFLIIGLRRIKFPTLGYKDGFLATFLSGLLLTVGSFGFNIGLSKGLASIVAPIAGAYPALFALLSSIIFRDPITKQQKIGMIITLVGIVLLAYFSK